MTIEEFEACNGTSKKPLKPYCCGGTGAGLHGGFDSMGPLRDYYGTRYPNTSRLPAKQLGPKEDDARGVGSAQVGMPLWHNYQDVDD